jgi:quinol monooxygenase YgiN
MKQLRNASRAEKATLRVDVNQTTENKGRRRLFEEFPKYVALDQINVTRDVLKFEFMLQSFTDPVELRYDLYIKNWTTTGMILHVNFSEPLLVSKGQLFDNAKVRIINPALFRSQQTGLTIPEVQDWMVEPFPVQVGEGVNLEALKAHAIWLTSVVHACIILTVAILTYLGAFPYLLWNCYFTL